jgi:hypothetical protein
MSHLYELGVAVAPTVTAAFVTIVAGAGTQAEIREITVGVTTTANRIEVALGRPAANGTGTITGTLVQACDPGDPAGQTTIVTTGGFGTAQPTVPANFMRDYLAGAVVADSVTWTWEPGELIIAPSGQFVLWNLVAAGTAAGDVYVKLAE